MKKAINPVPMTSSFNGTIIYEKITLSSGLLQLQMLFGQFLE